MTKQGTILIVDDNKGVLAAIDMLLSGTFKKVITISNPNRIPGRNTENKQRSTGRPIYSLCRHRTGRKNSERRGYRLCRQTLG